MQLGFLEVGFHPDLIQRHHGHQGGAGLHALTKLHCTLADEARDRRDDRRALQVEVGLAQLRGGGLHLRLVADGGGIDQRAVARQLALRARQRGFGGIQLRLGMREFLGRDRAGRDQAAAAGHVGACLRHCHLARGDVGLRRVHAAVQATHLAHGVGEIRFGLRVGDLRIVRIQLHKDLAGFDAHAVLGIDRDHRTRRLRGDADDVALHVGVVGRLVPARDREVPGEPGATGDQHHHEQDQQRALALAVAGRRDGRGRQRRGVAA